MPPTRCYSVRADCSQITYYHSPSPAIASRSVRNKVSSEMATVLAPTLPERSSTEMLGFCSRVNTGGIAQSLFLPPTDKGSQRYGLGEDGRKEADREVEEMLLGLSIHTWLGYIDSDFFLT